MIGKMAKKGMTPSQIGVLLRDSHGIAQVKSVTGSKILRILKGQGEQAGPLAAVVQAGRAARGAT
jgi:small subunit ribosomal protein S13e